MPKKTYSAKKVKDKRKKVFLFVLSSIAFTIVVIFGLSRVSAVKAYYDYVLHMCIIFRFENSGSFLG